MPDRQISVIGSGTCEEGSQAWTLAEEVGRRLAEAGATVVCGGLGGVMEAVSRAATAAGGVAIGIVPGDSPEHANPHCTYVVATSVGPARNLAVVASGQAAIAIGGEWGTLSELGFARRLGRPVISLRSWRPLGEGTMAEPAGISYAETPAQAVALALEAAASAG
jgi:uncharacterized protein (TIGR00725 family)